jgi:hypothetical protein
MAVPDDNLAAFSFQAGDARGIGAAAAVHARSNAGEELPKSLHFRANAKCHSGDGKRK